MVVIGYFNTFIERSMPKVRYVQLTIEKSIFIYKYTLLETTTRFIIIKINKSSTYFVGFPTLTLAITRINDSLMSQYHLHIQGKAN